MRVRITLDECPVVSFERAERLFSCHFKRKHFFSADIIKERIGSTNPNHVKGSFALKHLITSKWEVEETILTDFFFYFL